MIRCTFPLGDASIEDFEWQADDAQLASALNAMRRDEWLSPSVPDADYAAALDAIERLGGELVGKYEPPEAETGLIY
jgi:hypothetical protein